MQKLTIFHLYPDAMNLYGDLGNIVTLVRRMHERAISVDVLDIKCGDKADFKHADIIFMGGGQDRGQKAITDDLLRRGEEIKSEVEKGLVALTVCGGFQLFGKYFKTQNGDMLEGISVFDSYTVGSDKRCIGNIVIDISEQKWNSDLNTLVGFENHSGLTYLEEKTKPLGKVTIGYGNTGEKKYEGAVYKNAYGTYLHGPVLPKNPHFADHLILSALRRRYGRSATLKKADDSVEISAHEAAVQRARTAKTVHI
jgi:CobQ-like glutamine amidotransferase family enzyme